MFAALQLQVNLSANSPGGFHHHQEFERQKSTNDEDIDAALNELQITLEGKTTINHAKRSNYDAN